MDKDDLNSENKIESNPILPKENRNKRFRR